MYVFFDGYSRVCETKLDRSCLGNQERQKVNLKCNSQVPTNIPFKEKFLHGFAYQNRHSREVDEWPFHSRMATLADCSSFFPSSEQKISLVESRH